MGNLNFRTTQEQLTEFLAPAGEIVDVYFATDRDTGRPRGFAFVTFAEEKQASEAIERFNNQELDGRPLNINEARERDRGPAPDRPPRRRPGPRHESRHAPSPQGNGQGYRGGGGGGGGGFDPVPPPMSDDIDWEPRQELELDRGPDDGEQPWNEKEQDDWGNSKQKRNQKKKQKGSRRGLRARKRSL